VGRDGGAGIVDRVGMLRVQRVAVGVAVVGVTTPKVLRRDTARTAERATGITASTATRRATARATGAAFLVDGLACLLTG